MSKYAKYVLLIWVVFFTFSVTVPVRAAASTKVIPTISIVSVTPNASVTIHTYNFPASDVFEVLMGYIGSHGVGGIRVTTISTGHGGSLTLKFSIPYSLRGLDQIAIRLQSTSGSGYYAYNWFSNSGYGYGIHPKYGVGYYYPTFFIDSVVRNSSVTITVYNLPPHDSFIVLMNYMGTRGYHGVNVGSFNTGSGGTQTFTFNIPAFLYHQHQIAIRIQSTSGSRYFAFNWFYNNTVY